MDAPKLVLMIVGFAAAVSTLGFAFAADDFLVYENSDMGIRVDYPSDWLVDDSVFGSVTFEAPLDGPNDIFYENIGIALEYLNEPMTG